MFPSITFCPISMMDMEHRVAQNITSDYEELPKLEEMFAFLAHYYIHSNGYVVTENILSSTSWYFFRSRSDFILIPFEYQDSKNHFKLLNHHKNLFQVSIGPTIHSNGIKACLTYNPPGPNYPGYQRDRTVSNLILKLYFGILCQCIELDWRIMYSTFICIF